MTTLRTLYVPTHSPDCTTDRWSEVIEALYREDSDAWSVTRIDLDERGRLEASVDVTDDARDEIVADYQRRVDDAAPEWVWLPEWVQERIDVPAPTARRDAADRRADMAAKIEREVA